MKSLRFLVPALILVMALALFMVFLRVPAPENVPEETRQVFRIFYFHVSSAWVGFLSFAVTFIGSIMYLRGKGDVRGWDRLAASSAEIGVLFTTIVLITGPIWAKPAWQTYWQWEPKLTSALVLWFIYVAYLMLRGVVDEETKRGRFSAVLGIVGFVDVPIVFFAVKWWGSRFDLHPAMIDAAASQSGATSSGGGLSPEMLPTFLLSLLAFTCLYTTLLTLRFAIERDRQQANDLIHRLREE